METKWLILWFLAILIFANLPAVVKTLNKPRSSDPLAQQIEAIDNSDIYICDKAILIKELLAKYQVVTNATTNVVAVVPLEANK